MFLTKAKEIIQATNPKLEKLFVGCTAVEIATLEGILDVPIPAAFREFLLWFGKSGGNLMQGSDFYYGQISGLAFASQNHSGQDLSLKRDAIEILEEYNLPGKTILKNALVFMGHQGYTFDYIPTHVGDNPPVYYIQENETGIKIQSWESSFSDYIENLMQTQGKPSDSLRVHSAEDFKNPYSYDSCIKNLSFNGNLISDRGDFLPRFFDFPNLENLDLRGFGLTNIPDRIQSLSKLQSLNLNENMLETLPVGLFKLPKLETLYLARNELSTIPPEITQLRSLKTLDLSQNMIPKSDLIALSKSIPQVKLTF
ncbi:MAG TPA: SMI1/KNR4 family protein [Bacteroidetes bacterium]|nr:SMI1/KNR4 family protein [Bacteroidota bacterium]